jgi:hypothetical protein
LKTRVGYRNAKNSSVLQLFGAEESATLVGGNLEQTFHITALGRRICRPLLPFFGPSMMSQGVVREKRSNGLDQQNTCLETTVSVGQMWGNIGQDTIYRSTNTTATLFHD